MRIKDIQVYLILIAAFWAVFSSAFAEKFTFVAIPDSQGYPNDENQPASGNLFLEEIQWIRDNISALNIKFVAHEGDIVNWSNSEQWTIAVNGMQPLKNTIPMCIVPGNHDYDVLGKPVTGSSEWTSRFGKNSSFFSGKSWYGGSYTDPDDPSDPSYLTGMSSWQTFTASGINFLHIGLECEPCDDVLNWAKGVCDSHPGWPTIITMHKFIALDASYQPATLREGYPRNNTQGVWDKLIKVRPQIFMILCGHFAEDWNVAARRTDQNNSGWDVHQIVADYQTIFSGTNLGRGGGWIRLLEFSPETNSIRVKTYSTIINKYSTDPSLTDGSSYALNRAPFNYEGGTGALYAESHFKSNEFTLPFIYGQQLPRPAQSFGQNLSGLLKSFSIAGTGNWCAGGLAFDPSYKVNGNYDWIYYANRDGQTGAQGLYRASIASGTSSGRLALSAITNPLGCTIDSGGSAYLCYNEPPAVWKVANPSGATTQMLGNYQSTNNDDDPYCIMMVPQGFGGGFDEGGDLVLIDTGIDADSTEAVVVVRSNSTAESPQYTVLWQDTTNYFTTDIYGAASAYDGYIYIVPTTIPFANLGGVSRPYICRIKGDGIMQRIFISADITYGGAAPYCDNSIAVNPANGSVWLATTAHVDEGLTYPRTLGRIDVKNAVWQTGNDYLANVSAEITNAYFNIGANGMTWSPDGKYLAISCIDSEKMYIYTASVPADCTDAINKGYGLAYDFNNDCKVNLVDFASIEIDELAQFAMQWLECIDPQTCTWIWP